MYRNRKLLDIAKESPVCFGCGSHNDGTVVSAHANWMKGMGIKADDLPAFLCAKCHYDCDNARDMTREQRQIFWARAFFKTMKWLLETERLVLK